MDVTMASKVWGWDPKKQTPNPGSDLALDQGCSCAVLDNGHGRGYLGDGVRFGWVVNGECELHGKGAAPDA